jgi:hypothetical protein
VVPRAHMIGMLDTLEYLAKGGRVPRVTAWLSSLVQVKPVFGFYDGRVSRWEQCGPGGAPGPPAGPDAPAPEPGSPSTRGRLPFPFLSRRRSS